MLSVILFIITVVSFVRGSHLRVLRFEVRVRHVFLDGPVYGERTFLNSCRTDQRGEEDHGHRPRATGHKHKNTDPRIKK